MRLTPSTPRRAVKRLVWALIGAGCKVSYHLGGETLLRRFVYAMPIERLVSADRRDAVYVGIEHGPG